MTLPAKGTIQTIIWTPGARYIKQTITTPDWEMTTKKWIKRQTP